MRHTVVDSRSVSDFKPTTELPETIELDDAPVESTAKSRDLVIQRRRRLLTRWVVLGLGLALVATGFTAWRVLIAMSATYLILGVGIAVIGAFARPVPEPPPPGELRKVKLTYRCSSCGAELRMSLANDQVPQPPRHCADEMELTTDLNEI